MSNYFIRVYLTTLIYGANCWTNLYVCYHVNVCDSLDTYQEEIDGLATNYPCRFHVYYVLNQVYLQIFQFWLYILKAYYFHLVFFSILQPPEEWTGGVGFISKDIIRAHCPAPASDIKVWLKHVLIFPTLFMTQVIPAYSQKKIYGKLGLITLLNLQIMICGPRPMNFAMPRLLKELGYSPGMQIHF